ncbi:MAG TPA: DUF1549 and DUF1553 domain-containing protein [Gemmataceae bacterium]|jgi:hypothetical protein|nr:DUF1549 and DUF1553 domain-containing protein [Gemmataceae bacterium]
MPTRFSRWLFLLATATIFAPSAFADEAPKAPPPFDTVALPKPADVKSLAVYPTQVNLSGLDDAAQLVVTATLNDGRLQDLSSDVEYAVTEAKTARILPSGRVLPLANGAAQIVAKFGNKTVSVPVAVKHADENLPINFPNQVVPVFTKLGCNSGGCHGKASGQNGFKISLLGYEPEVDYTALVKEDRGRRLMPAAPDSSLLLLKATGLAPHGGGKKMEKDSDEYRLVRRWIAAGTPYGKETDPTVTKITVYPEHRVMTRQNKQQFAVYAHYSDGVVEDITRRAQYDSNDQEIANVDPAGQVRTLALSGEAAIMARYQGHVGVFRATVPLGAKTPDWQFPVSTVVDNFTSKKWKDLGLVPSDIAADEIFIRRAYLDLTGTLPTPKQVSDFVADKDAKKREVLVDRLVDSPEFSYYFANKWADILRVKRGRDGQNGIQRAQGTFAFHNWIREAIAADKPYDEFVRDILIATGEESKNPPTVWYKDLTQPEQFVDDTAQVFLGLRIACANCHHHPYEKWSQDDYWGLAAFFGRVAKKQVPVPGTQQQTNIQVIYSRPDGSVTNKRTQKQATLKALDGDPMEIDRGDDPRTKLVDWMTDPKNPFFAKAVANRYWAHFFGRGIVDPIDDMRVTNPPSNPELLDALAKTLVDNKFSLKALVKVIAKSRTYQLSALPNEFNKHDKQTFARYYPKRMGAEVLLDAVCQVTDSPTQFGGLPQDKFAPKRAIMLPDESFNSYFLDVFGRPQRISACECERVSEANLAQALHLLNSDEIQQKLSRANGRADALANAKDTRPDAEKVTELFNWTFGRKPTDDDMKTALAHIEKHKANKKIAYENILWALINTKEFVFVQ